MKSKFSVLGLLFVLAIFGCFVVPQTDTAAPPAPVAGAERGTVTLALPAISSYMAKALGVPPSVASSPARAVLIINTVELELWLAGTLIDSLSASPNAGPNMDQPISWDVPAASGYTVRAAIYNTSVDAATPMLYGESAPFDVTAGGSTNVTIRPIPYPPLTRAPITVPSGGVANATLTSCFETGDFQFMTVGPGLDGVWGTADDDTIQIPVYAWRDEAWFKIDTSLFSAIRVNADPDAASGVYMVFADGTGAARAHALSGAMGNMGPAYWTYGGVASIGSLVSGNTCYLGVITLSSTTGSSVESSVAVSFSPMSDDPYEENDTIETAADLPKTVVVDGVDLDTPNRYTWPGVGGDWYKITLAGADDPNVTIVLEFDMDQADLGLELFSWNGMGWYGEASSDASVLSGPASPAEKEEERIARTLTPGDYYLWVYSSQAQWASGIGYRLQWVSGQGQIIIGLE